MGSPKGLKKANWSGSPAGWLFKGIITIYRKKGFRQSELASKFREHVSKELYIHYINVDVTDNAIDQRGARGTEAKYEKEHPDKHPMGSRMWPFAQKVVEERLVLDREKISKIENEAMSGYSDPMPIEETVTVIDNEGVTQVGLIYVLGNNVDLDHCAIGMTTQTDVTKRTNGFIKGDISGTLELRHLLWLENPAKIEAEFKRSLKEFSFGNERFTLMPDQAIRILRRIADKHAIAYRNVKVEK
jgi:hypothetical protein